MTTKKKKKNKAQKTFLARPSALGQSFSVTHVAQMKTDFKKGEMKTSSLYFSVLLSTSPVEANCWTLGPL